MAILLESAVGEQVCAQVAERHSIFFRRVGRIYPRRIPWFYLSTCDNLCRSFFPQLDLTLHQPWVIIQLCIITTWKPNGQDHRIDIVEYSRMSTLIAHLVWLVEILGVTFNNLCDLCRYTEMEVTVRTVFTSKKDKENSKVITYSARCNYGNDS